MLKVYSKPVWLRHSSLHLVTATIVLHFSVSYKLIRKGLVSGLKTALTLHLPPSSGNISKRKIWRWFIHSPLPPRCEASIRSVCGFLSGPPRRQGERSWPVSEIYTLLNMFYSSSKALDTVLLYRISIALSCQSIHLKKT